MVTLMGSSAQCPHCAKVIDRSVVDVVREFACPHCGQLVQTSRLFRFGMRTTSIGIATIVTWQSSAPGIEKFIEWPLLWILLTSIYIWMFSIARPPNLKKSEKKSGKDEEDFQRLGLS